MQVGGRSDAVIITLPFGGNFVGNDKESAVQEDFGDHTGGESTPLLFKLDGCKELSYPFAFQGSEQTVLNAHTHIH